jgi:hypothetical protein
LDALTKELWEMKSVEIMEERVVVAAVKIIMAGVLLDLAHPPPPPPPPPPYLCGFIANSSGLCFEHNIVGNLNYLFLQEKLNYLCLEFLNY